MNIETIWPSGICVLQHISIVPLLISVYLHIINTNDQFVSFLYLQIINKQQSSNINLFVLFNCKLFSNYKQTTNNKESKDQLVVNSSFSTSPSSIFLSTWAPAMKVKSIKYLSIQISFIFLLTWAAIKVKYKISKYSKIKYLSLRENNISSFLHDLFTFMHDLQLLASSTIFMLFFT